MKDRVKTICGALALLSVFFMMGVCGACERGNIENIECLAAVICLAALAYILHFMAKVLAKPQKTAKKEPPVLPTQSGSEGKINNNIIIAQKEHKSNPLNIRKTHEKRILQNLMISDTKAKENFVTNELLSVLRKVYKDIIDAWYDEENGKEYIYIELDCGQIQRVNVTGDGITSMLLDVMYALD